MTPPCMVDIEFAVADSTCWIRHVDQLRHNLVVEFRNSSSDWSSIRDSWCHDGHWGIHDMFWHVLSMALTYSIFWHVLRRKPTRCMNGEPKLRRAFGTFLLHGVWIDRKFTRTATHELKSLVSVRRISTPERTSSLFRKWPKSTNLHNSVAG